MHSLGFLPVITKPTRYSNSVNTTNPSLLDHIWLNTLNRYECGIMYVDISDHLPVYVRFSVGKVTNRFLKIKFRLHDREHLNSFVSEIRLIKWNDVLSHNCFNENVIVFSSTINKLYCRFFPVKIKHINTKRFRNPWITKGIMKSIKTRSKLFKYFKSGLISRAVYNKYRNLLTKIISKAKNNHYCNYFNSCKNDLKKTWKKIKNILSSNHKSNIIDKIRSNDSILDDPVDVCNSFVEYFSSVASDLDSKLPNTNISPTDYISVNVSHSMFLTPVSVSECLYVISNLKNKSYGINSIPVSIFKLIKSFIVHPLTTLINFSFQSGIFPDCLKVANIIPIFKKDDPTEMSNYRPIAILPLLSKIFEKVIYNRLLNFIRKNNIISMKQFGFQNKISTCDATVSLCEYIYNSLNNRNHCANVLIDYCKAFDTVNHSILLNKLHAYGIRGVVNQLFKSYLANRPISVKIGNICSNQHIINIGIPQGSVLGPLLFLIYINDLTNVSNKLSVLLFADDTTLSYSDYNYNSLISMVNSELKLIECWTKTNRLSLNVSKTYVLLVSNRSHDIDGELPVFLLDNDVKFCNTVKFLGVHIDSDMKFDSHVNHVKNKISKYIGIFYRLRKFVPEYVLIKLYYSLVYPYLSYCIPIWGAAYDNHISNLIVIHKKLIRVITCSDYNAHTSPLFYRLEILKLKDIYTFSLAVEMFKYNKGLTNNNNYNASHREQVYNTRNKNAMLPTFQRLTTTQQSISYRAPHVWNSLPVSLKELSSLPKFKLETRKYLLSFY